MPRTDGHTDTDKFRIVSEPGVTEVEPEGGTTASSAVKWTALVLVLVLGLALVLLVAEGGVRLRQWIRTGTAQSFTDMYRTDETIGLRVLNPGFRSRAISINRSGFRGPEIATPKPKGVIRVAFLGASTTFCAEVSSDAAVWPSIVVERLRQAYPQARFDFVNGGVPGYIVAASRKNLKHRVAALEPDIIVVYHATNDLSGEVRQRAIQAGIPGAAQAGRQSWLERHSLLWELVVKNLRVWEVQRDAGHAQRLSVDAKELGRWFEPELGALLREAKSTGARVAVATFSTRLRADQAVETQRQAAVSALVYMPFMSIDGLVAGYRRYNDIIRSAAASEGVLLIGDEERIPGDAAHFVDSVHFSDAGSRAMADRVVAALASDDNIAQRIRLASPAP